MPVVLPTTIKAIKDTTEEVVELEVPTRTTMVSRMALSFRPQLLRTAVVTDMLLLLDHHHQERML
jgi:hypothetical protein